MIIGYSGKIQGLFRPFQSSADTIQYKLIRHESARFSVNQPESEPHRRELWKKKTRGKTWPDTRATTSLARRCVGPHQTRVRLLWHRVRASQVLS